MAEKRGEAVEHGCIVLICIFGCGGRGQGTQEVVRARAGAIVQQQLRGLHVLDTGDALEESVMFRALELQSLLDVRVSAKGCAKDREPLFSGSAQSPTQTWASWSSCRAEIPAGSSTCAWAQSGS